MIQFEIRSGRKAGTVTVARRFPFQIGRAGADLVLEEEGVWEEHAAICLRPQRDFLLKSNSQAFTSVNGEQVIEQALKNGDLLEVGSVQIRFGFAPTRQRGVRSRETMTWIGLALLCLAQVALIYLVGT